MARVRYVCTRTEAIDPDTGSVSVNFENATVPFTAEEEAAADAEEAAAVLDHAHVVTRRQFMMALYVWDLKVLADAIVAQAGGITMIAWDATTDFYITDPMLVSLVAQLGKSDQLQEFFDFAATL